MKKNKKYHRTALATALALSVSFTGCSNETENVSSDSKKAVGTFTKDGTVKNTSVQAAKKSVSVNPDAKNEKEETVYGILNADGSLNHTIISNWLKNFESSSSLKVASNLTDVKNVNGDETFTKDADGMLVWDANGNDIYYQGSNSDELPVSVKIIYKLDGKEMSPEEMAGKSGKVTIRYEYTNNTKNTIKVNGKEETVSTPFAVITGMVLPTETFTNVEVENARILSDGSSQIAVGCAFPGLQKSLGVTDKDLKEISDDFTIPDYIEITADVENFSMDMTLSIVSSRIFAEMKDDFDEKIDDLDDLSKDLDDLEDGMKELKDGAAELKDGAGELRDGAKELNDGATDLKDGAKELNDGAADLKDGAKELKDGTEDLKDGAKELQDGTKTLKDGLSTLNKKAGDMTNGISTLKKGVKQYTAGVSALKEGAGTLQAAYEGKNGAVAGAAALAEGTQTLYDTVTNFSLDTAALAIDVDIDTSSLVDEKAILADCTDAATTYIKENNIDVTTPEGKAILQAFQAGCTAGTGTVSKNLQKAFASQKDSIANAVSSQIKQQIGKTLETVMQQMGSAAKQLNDGAGALSTGVQKLYAGTKQVNEGITALDENSAALNEGTKTLKSGWSQYAEGVAAADSGVSTLFSGVKTLAKGTIKLDDGAGKLQDGTKDLKDGTVKLFDGTKDLKDGTTELYDGTKELYDGTVDLKDGVKTLDEDAIQKILDLFGDEMDEYKDRLRGLFHSAKNYDSFSGSMDDVENSVKFILKTAEISNEEE